MAGGSVTVGYVPPIVSTVLPAQWPTIGVLLTPRMYVGWGSHELGVRNGTSDIGGAHVTITGRNFGPSLSAITVVVATGSPVLQRDSGSVCGCAGL